MPKLTPERVARLDALIAEKWAANAAWREARDRALKARGDQDEAMMRETKADQEIQDLLFGSTDS